jgi:polyferredoxin
VAAFIIVGLYLNAPFTSLEAARLLQGDIPATETPWRITLFVAIITISCLWGQAFCGFLCPFGALQEFISLKALRRRASPDIEQAGRYLKFVVLAVLLCLFLLTDDIVWFSFSPLQHFFRGEMGWWVLALSMLVLAASLFYFRFWCRYLCPAGAFLALFNKLSLLRRWSPRPAPSRCDLGVTLATDVDCIRCHRCLFEDAAAAKDK